MGPNKSGDFPRIDFGDPPSKSEKTLTGLLKPTIDKGAGSFVSGGPHGPKEGGNSLILDFYCQHLRRVLFVLCLGALTGPGKFGLILRLYYVKVNMLENISYFSLCMVPNWSRCQIGTGAKLTPFTLLVPNWSGAKLTLVPN